MSFWGDLGNLVNSIPIAESQKISSGFGSYEISGCKCWCRFPCFESWVLSHVESDWNVVIGKRGAWSFKRQSKSVTISNFQNISISKKETFLLTLGALLYKLSCCVRTFWTVRVGLPCSNSKQQQLLSISISWMKCLINYFKI
jgi:hypothetical protein